MQESPETTEAMDAMEKFLAGSTLELETLRQQTEASELTCQVLQASRCTPSSSDNDQFWGLRAWPNRIQEVSVFPASARAAGCRGHAEPCRVGNQLGACLWANHQQEGLAMHSRYAAERKGL